MQLWPPQHSAALFARASALVAKLCLTFKRLFQAEKSHIQEDASLKLPPIEYKSAKTKRLYTISTANGCRQGFTALPHSKYVEYMSLAVLVNPYLRSFAANSCTASKTAKAKTVKATLEPVAAGDSDAAEPNTRKAKAAKPKAERAAGSDPAKPKRKRVKKGPCPHCGRPYGKQFINHAEQCLREKRKHERMEREKATIRKQAEMAVEGQEVKEKPVKEKAPKIQTDVDRPKPYNVRCPHCKRLIKQPYDVVGDDAYHAARKPLSDAIWQEFNQPTGQLKPLLEARWRVDTWLLTLAVPHLKEADAALRAKPSFSNGQPIEIMVPWNSPPPHFVPPDEKDERACLELKDYKKKERRLRAEAKRRAAGQRPRNYDNVYEKNYRIVRNGKFDTGYTKIYDKDAKSEQDSGYPDSYSKPKASDTGYPDSYSKQKNDGWFEDDD